ncbi:MAG: hypothetical protein JNN30_13880 [Rhodanobacteraceae bacterium]|nr:hypothetical protein [Rhodanobacteraceae bacterium]
MHGSGAQSYPAPGKTAAQGLEARSLRVRARQQYQQLQQPHVWAWRWQVTQCALMHPVPPEAGIEEVRALAECVENLAA